MTESFVTDLPDGALPVPAISAGDAESLELVTPRQVCDEVTLTITLLVVTEHGIVARFALDSPYWIDNHDLANGTWSLALPRYEMMHLLCTYLHSKFMKVIVKREELLHG